MKRFFYCLCVVLCAMSCSKGGEPVVCCGHLDNYVDFPSRYVSPRTVRVWTPTCYDPSKRYEVLYMHDGKMLFDASVTWNHQEWGVDEVVDSLISCGAIRECIVVGIDNTDERISDYCPDDIVQYLPAGSSVYRGLASQGNAYLSFLVDEVKPFVDSVYSTYGDREHTWVLGSSCGGLISSYALCKYSDVFGGAACMSTHCTLAYPHPDAVDSLVVRAYRTYLEEHLPSANSALLYMDNGDKTLDSFYGESQHAINVMLYQHGWDSAHYMYRYFPGAAHCEDDWRARLDVPLKFLLGK